VCVSLIPVFEACCEAVDELSRILKRHKARRNPLRSGAEASGEEASVARRLSPRGEKVCTHGKIEHVSRGAYDERVNPEVEDREIRIDKPKTPVRRMAFC
jgi:hypothetical protein